MQRSVFVMSITGFGVLLISLLTTAIGDDDHETDRIELLRSYSTGVAVVEHQAYNDECDSCHMAYPPGLLPARSWEKLMSELDDHFGDNAELDEQLLSELTAYLTDHAADQSRYRRSRKIRGSIPSNETPVRITDTPYIRRNTGSCPATWWRKIRRS